jgi:integrase
MAKDLTVKALENLKPGPARREVPDGHTRGLFYILQPSGAASWALRYRFVGKPKKLTLGPYPAIDLPAARRLASEAVQAVARGEDPALAKQAARQSARAEAEPVRDLVEDVVSLFIERHAKAKTRSWAETERMLKKDVVGPWSGRRLSAIGRADVHELLDGIVDRGAPIAANRILAALRRLCSWSVERGIIQSSPCDGVKAPSAIRTRDRVLVDDEIKIAWTAFERSGWPFGKLAQLLLLTGARRDEIAEAKWSEIDLDAKTLTLPPERSKNGQRHEIPLSDTAKQIIATLPKVSPGKGKEAIFMITTTGKSPISGFSKAKDQIDAAILDALRAEAAGRGENPEDVKEPANWTFHDLRRSAASGMAGLGIAPHVVEAVLNHKSGTIKGVAAVYNRYSYADEKKAALEAWARKLDAIVSGKPAGNVVDLAQVRA